MSVAYKNFKSLGELFVDAQHFEWTRRFLEQGLRMLENCTESNEQVVEFLYLLGQNNERISDLEGAERYYTRLLQIAESNSWEEEVLRMIKVAMISCANKLTFCCCYCLDYKRENVSLS